ncbi:efflux RND transporter periplasmic adaptor subunit [Robertkochia solimangrovi]|uniref:efflux RND transporter periplasmic adaptor subunit n=1 Tax=Robertkochia solimangrovi TaxID=2213046 RepID=UPI00117F46C7|nr:efflux RND transporter periplasmic adaptor subunit [Robertkochia solimangrovi]TRZ42018.1 efflux RND transporter periplasmic adaptor subunit [Robertkochia solimangrovi]
MKKYLIYTGMLIAGLLIGYLLFNSNGNNHNHEAEKEASAPETKFWTCSMHPQIMKTEPGDCPICGMELIPADANADGLTAAQFRMSEHAMALADINTFPVGSSETEKGTLTLSGEIRTNEKSAAVQSSYFKGRIEELMIRSEGESVKIGQMLARIYSPDLIAAQQELLTASKLKSRQPELYQAVRQKLLNWKLSEKQITAVENSGKVSEYFPVYATISGTISAKLVEEGDYVQTGQPLFKIEKLTDLWAIFDLYESDLGAVQQGQKMEIITNAYPGKSFSGNIDFIDPILNSQKRTVEIRVQLQNNNGELKPGMFVEGTVQIAKTSEKDVLLVPKSSILWTGKRSVVYVKSADAPVFEMRIVTLGEDLGDSYIIKSGLEKGDLVVSQGTFTVDAAAQLQGKKSMMNRMENAKGETMQMNFSARFKEQMDPLLQEYLNLQEALVGSDAAKVKVSATKAATIFEQLDRSGLGAMENEHLKMIGFLLDKTSNSTDLEVQRDAFVNLSEQMITIYRSFPDLDRSLYVINCPMANHNKGANWLSENKEVLNPYYGEAMLKCGSVTEVLQ